MSNIGKIVYDYLEMHGYDGLYDADGECGCEKNDLFPCDNILASCTPGYRQPCTCPEQHNFHIGAKKHVTTPGNPDV